MPSYIGVALISFVVFSIAFKAVWWEIRPDPLGPFWKVPEAASDPAINVIFFGTSHIEQGVIPAVFDDAARSSGISGLRSYNLAYPDASMLESFADSEDLFRLKPHGIKFVAFEPLLVSTLLSADTNTLRALRFYSLSHARWALALRQSIVPRWQYRGNIVGAVLRHYFGIGLAFTGADPRQSWRISTESRGFPDLDEWTHHVFAGGADYDNLVAAYAKEPPRYDGVSPSELHLVLSFASAIAAQGAVPIIVKPPDQNMVGEAIVARLDRDCAGQLPLRFDLSSPTKYPELWQPRNRSNSDHLNIDGAAIFSRLLAGKLRAAINDGSISRPLCKG